MIHFDIPKLEIELKYLEEKTMQEGFWNDQKESSKVLAEIKSRKSKVAKYKELSDELENVLELIELLEIEQDESLENEINLSSKKIGKEIERFELQTLLSGKYD